MTVQQEIDTGYYTPDACSLTAFKILCSRTTTKEDAPSASAIEKNVPIYDATALAGILAIPQKRQELMAEWANILMAGAGVLVIKAAQPDHAAIDAATRCYDAIIAEEKAVNGGGADHFAKAGANDRVWNSLQKLCLREPETFARYFGSSALDAACEAWLGPNYQMTAQVNLVRPGGEAQQAHRDYHLGFQTEAVSMAYPAHVHLLSQVLTLQAGLAHCDIPVEAGPTKLLPFSQTFKPGYVAWRRPDFRAWFEEHHVQLPLEKGDMIFFSPALFHAAGANRTADLQRMVNLFQVSSAMGRAMESVDRAAMCRALYPVIAKGKADLGEARIAAAIASCAEGYSFPTNLDRDPPVGGLAPATQADLFRKGLAEGWSAADFNEALDALEARKLA